MTPGGEPVLKLSAKNILGSVVTSALFTVCVLPGYNLIGSLFKHIGVTFLLSLLICLCFDLIKFDAVCFGVGISFMFCFWTVYSLILQIRSHIAASDFSIWWHYIFYYDRIALLYVAWSACALFFIIKLIIKARKGDYLYEYKRFSKPAYSTFIVFYLLTLVFCFVLSRRPATEPLPVNMVPFTALRDAFLGDRLDYELVFLFIGNIAIFIPLGIILGVLFKKKSLVPVFIIPVIVTVLIEVSQYFLKNGNCDIDDCILNILGSYIGTGFQFLVDKAIFRATRGEADSAVILSD